MFVIFFTFANTKNLYGLLHFFCLQKSVSLHHHLPVCVLLKSKNIITDLRMIFLLKRNLNMHKILNDGSILESQFLQTACIQRDTLTFSINLWIKVFLVFEVTWMLMKIFNGHGGDFSPGRKHYHVAFELTAFMTLGGWHGGNTRAESNESLSHKRIDI